MSITPDPSDPVHIDEMPTPQIVSLALTKWEGLTGVSADAKSWRMRDLDVRDMNNIMADALKLDPEGTTTYLLLEVFLREYLEQKTFTVARIMKDYAATKAYLEQAEELFSIVQSDLAVEMAANFRARVLRGIGHYGADRSDVIEMVNDADALAFLRRDALHSLHGLKPFQFLSGEQGNGVAQVIEHVYQAWNINDLLVGLRDMPVNGIAVVLLRDPAHPERSYFCFAMRNGGNVFLFTDKSKPVYPGQEDALRGRRSVGRDFMSRTYANHFPYQLIKKHFDEKGDVHFDAETAPVMEGVNLVPLMRIKELPPHQVIWITMMLSLVSDRFWHQKWKAPELSYTGEMIRNKVALVTDKTGAQLPAAAGYQAITLDEVQLEDLTADSISVQVRNGGSRINQWLEDRYRARVPHAVLNQWNIDANTKLLLPRQMGKHDRPRVQIPVNKDGIIAYVEKGTHDWDKPDGYKLQTFSATEFGTEAELKADRLWIARYNMAEYVQKCADEEFEARKADVAHWYLNAVKKNKKAILAMIAARRMPSEVDLTRVSHRLTFKDVKDKDWSYTHYSVNKLCELNYRGEPLCVLTGAAPSYRAFLRPKTERDLADLCGVEVSGLPDVLQNWHMDRDYAGNHLLDRLDPMDYRVENPWKKLDLRVNVYLSKRGAKVAGILSP